MKKVLSILLAVCLLVGCMPLAASATGGNVSYNGTTYETIQAAVDQIPASGTATIELTGDVTGNIQLNGTGKNVTINMNGHTWTTGPDGVGSSDQTATAGLQLLKGNTVTIDGSNSEGENSVIDVVADAENLHTMIQNYANLTLKNVTLDGRNQHEANFEGVGFTKTNTYTLNSYCGTVSLQGVTIKNSTRTETAYSIGCGWWSSNNYKTGTQITVDSNCVLENALIYRDDNNQDSNSKSTLTYGGTELKGTWAKGDNTGCEIAYTFNSTLGFYQTTDSTVTDVPTSVSGEYPNPTGGVSFNGKTVTVTGELPYISGRTDTANGNYVWMKISLPTGVTFNNASTITIDGTTVKYSEFDDTDNDGNKDAICLHQSITSSDVTKGTKTITIKWDATHVDVYTINLTKASLESAPSTGGSGSAGGSTGGSPTTPDEPETPDEDTPTTETTTSADGTTTTTTTWSSGKTATTVKTPEGDVTTTVKSSTGETIATIDLPADPGKGKDFDDVKGWSKNAIEQATAYGLFSGQSETKFNPKGDMTRGMVAQVLYNLSGKPGYGVGTGSFSDTKGYYNNAIDWAAKTGVASGNGNGTFTPDDSVTREQLVTMLYNFAKAIGATGSTTGSISSFPDSGKTSSWAAEAMSWAVANGLISGSAEGGTTYLNPKDAATREQVASIMVKFVQFLSK